MLEVPLTALSVDPPATAPIMLGQRLLMEML